MKLYHVERVDDYDYDNYIEFVCAAESEKEARETSPDEYHVLKDNDWHFVYHDGRTEKITRTHNWVDALSLSTLKVTEIGEANPSVPKGVIVAQDLNG